MNLHRPAVRDGALAEPEALVAAVRQVLSFWDAREGRSHDPYDGLASAWLSRSSAVPRPVRLALVQLHKRSPVDLRALFGIPPTRNPYGEGLFASARLILWTLSGEEEDLAGAARHLRWLEAHRIRGGWAYPFDVQTRTFFYDGSTPNVVCTAFAAQAFLDAALLTGEAGHLRVAEEAAGFAMSELLVDGGDGSWFGYLPGDRTLIHNANLLAARLCVRAGVMEGGGDLVEAGRRAVATTLSHQRPDGAFPYGDGAGLGWIDGHHSGFVVECLWDLAAEVPEAAGALRTAAAHYARELFRPDGAPRPAPGRDVPVDALAGAQGIQTFAKLGDLERAGRTAGWMLGHMRNADGTFVFQRGRVHRKRVRYARWSDAPMALALATLARRWL